MTEKKSFLSEMDAFLQESQAKLDELSPKKVRPEVLLSELDDLLRNRPTAAAIVDGENDALDWVGRAVSAVTHAELNYAMLAQARMQLLSGNLNGFEAGHRSLLALLSEARHSIRLKLAKPSSIAIEKGSVFDYFDGIRKIIGAATTELLVVDPYLDAEFVSAYLPQVPAGVAVRLLAGMSEKRLSALVPTVEAWATQNAAKVHLRVVSSMHDRYIFVDRKDCYQSGASFNAGAKHAPTTLTQIVDAFAAMLETYEKMWTGAKVVR